MVADPADELGYFVPDSAGLSMNAFLHFGLANGTPDLDFLYGNPGDSGLIGDWDGNGVDTIAVARPAGAGGAEFYLRNSNTTGIADLVFAPFGPATYTPLHGRFGLG